MTTVKYEDLSLAFEFVSSSAPHENHALISLDTGLIFWMSEFSDVEQEELPDDIDTSDRYLEIPHKNDLDLGRELVLRFAEERMPNRYDRIDGIFRSRGAYGRFKDLLEADGRLDEWCAYDDVHPKTGEFVMLAADEPLQPRLTCRAQWGTVAESTVAGHDKSYRPRA